VVRSWPADLRPDDLLLTAKRHFVIINPASGRRRGKPRLAAYRRLLREALEHVTFAETSRPGEERDLADRALAEGADVIVAVGGDGTWSNVADRLVASGRADVALGLLPSGTGNDFGRNFGYDARRPAEAVAVIARGRQRPIDVGRVDTPTAPEHHPDLLESRHFLNLIGFGFDIAVIDAAARARFLTGALLYKVTALQQLVRFRGVRARLEGSRGAARDGTRLMVTISNGRYFGGGFPIAPDATVDDGELHACLIDDGPPLTRLGLFSLAERGRHVSSERVEIIDDDAFRLTFESPPRFEMDGDIRSCPEAVIEVRSLPRALNVVAP